jgi:hypothetical protein
MQLPEARRLCRLLLGGDALLSRLRFGHKAINGIEVHLFDRLPQRIAQDFQPHIEQRHVIASSTWFLDACGQKTHRRRPNPFRRL